MPRIILLSNPRSGSTYLQDLLSCDPEIEILEELLNPEEGLLNNPLETVQESLSAVNKTYVGFKLFPEQLYAYNMHFGELVNSTGINHVVVLWREELLDGFVSREIAYRTNEWYSTSKPNAVRKVKVESSLFKEYTARLNTEWEKIGKEWPVDVRPIFVKFEDLIKKPNDEVKRVLAEMSIACSMEMFITPSERQNPAPIHEKVINYDELEPELRESTLNVAEILLGKINVSLQIPKELLHFAPDREPCMPAEGWKYRVAEPYLPALAKQNAFDAIQSGSISSAGYWPRELAKRLRSIFRCPVAQPCSTGFSALLLAMQAAGIGEGDEVIVPTMTMVAVANAVYYLRATPVFADNAKDGYNPTWAEYEVAATDKTKAVIVTHTYGVPVPDIEEIARECRSRGWVLIEDISECVGVSCSTSKGQQQLLGTFGDYAIASLYANKMIHGGDGGFVIAKEAKIGKRLASIVNHGFTPSFHFVHFEQAPNAKINGIGAAVASGCLDELQFVMEHRTQLAMWYREALRDLPLKTMPECGPYDTPWIFGIQCHSKEERTNLRAFLATHGIETRDYFFCLHLQPAYLKNGIYDSTSSLPNAEMLGSTGFYLPTHTNLRQDDVNFICNVIKAYYSTTESSSSLIAPQKRSKIREAVQIEADGFAIQVRKYRDTGELMETCTRDHIFLEAVKIGLQAEDTLFGERYDQIHLLLDSIKSVLKRAADMPHYRSMQNYFNIFTSYFESQHILEQPVNRPWLQIDLNNKSYSTTKQIPTTTDPETLQLLIQLIEQQKPNTIWEIGCWMGHATALMAQTCSALNLNTKIFACDAFLWQEWMYGFIDKDTYVPKNEKSFLKIFKANVSSHENLIHPVSWPYYISKLPTEMESDRPQLVYLDITQESEDLEEIWALIKKSLIPNETIIMFNGLVHTSVPFFTKHAKQLRAVAKPHTIAKAFLFVGDGQDENVIKEEGEYDEMMKTIQHLKKTVKFHTNPGWDHHHDNLFCKCIDLLRQKYHSDEADILFVPAVEETMCDEPEVMYNQPWIGIIHSVENHPELFYVTDLQRLCTRRRYLAAMKNCKGLFTLTSFQAKYLSSLLPSSLPKFPIQRLYYPYELNREVGCSIVPQLMRKQEFPIRLIHVGSFARDFDLFFKTPIPVNSQRFYKVLVAGDDTAKEASSNASSDVIITERLSEEEYEEILKTSIVFLTLKYEGAANTLILECIARNVPILSPRLSSCVDYLGKDYPLLYDPLQMSEQLDKLLTLESVEQAIIYLERMDKSKFTYQRFVNDVKNGAVMLSVPPQKTSVNLLEGELKTPPRTYDVTISICSYKRTHHLPKILESLWKNQDFTGSYEIIIWNNNECRNDLVQQSSRKYIEQSTAQKSLQVINSTENHYCSIRFALASLMKGESLLICDDDIIPGKNYISFFYSAHQKHPGDVLCVRGHEMLPHSLDMSDPRKVWLEYEGIRFRDDSQPEQLIHFVHADACLIPKEALQQVASVPMPDPSFVLVDDYWMSFVLNHKFNRKLRKLSTAELFNSPVERTDDSDTAGLALHTRPDVMDARLRLYVHHMMECWPSWGSEKVFSNSLELSENKENYLKEQKRKFWNGPSQIGYNIHSELDDEGIEALSETGTTCVRIGAVGVGEDRFYELSGFLTEPEDQLERLEEFIVKLNKKGIAVVLTLERRLASPQTWKLIAERLVNHENVIGYDVINEPFTEYEKEQHWADLESVTTSDSEMEKVVQMYKEMIKSIRQVDKMTPIILEPTFWGQTYALSKFPMESMFEIDDNLLVSFHFYQPMELTNREQNSGRYSFPCTVPWYDGVKFSEETTWNEKTILTKFEEAKVWAESKRVGIFLGEFGIGRDIGGAPEYLAAVINACKKVGMTGMLFSFRDPEWEAMDYEFGANASNVFRICDEKKNPFVRIINEGIRK